MEKIRISASCPSCGDMIPMDTTVEHGWDFDEDKQVDVLVVEMFDVWAHSLVHGEE